MEQTTDSAPAVRPEARVVPEAPESDPLDNVRAATWSADRSFDKSPVPASQMQSSFDQGNLQLAGLNDAGEMPYLNTGDLYKNALGTRETPGANPGDRLQLASLRPTLGDRQSGDGAVQPSLETMQRLNGMLTGLKGGDVSGIQQYLRDMKNAVDPRKQQELQAGMKMFTDYLNNSGVEAKMVMGNLSITLPGPNGKNLTIDKDGTNLRGNQLRDFGRRLSEKMNEEPSSGEPISEKMTDRLDRIEAGLNRGSLSGLQDAIKEIGDKIHSVKPGAAGAAERKEAKDLQEMLGVLSYELSRDNVDARYDTQSGAFKITQPGANGRSETLEIDKFGRANMSGEELRGFLIRLRNHQHKQPVMQG